MPEHQSKGQPWETCSMKGKFVIRRLTKIRRRPVPSLVNYSEVIRSVICAG